MTVLPDTFRLHPRDPEAPPPVFTGVRAQGRIDGPLFTLDIRQGYRNGGTRPLEVVCTLPLPAGAVLLEFAATLGDRRIACEILPRAQAVERYENALAEGDAPVLLESLDDGLYTANIGNLKPGESIELELRFAQLLAFEAGRLRLAIPTTIAPRYGNPLAAGLQPQQVPLVDPSASHPLALTLTVHGDLANAIVSCPSHTMHPTREPQALRLDLAPGARLDRDLVLLLEPPQARASMLTLAPAIAADPGQVALATFALPAGAVVDNPIALVMLVDCSGSMNGPGIESARRALTGLLPAIDERDTIGLLRFGSSTELTLAPRPADLEGRRALRLAIGAMRADLGGTEIATALDAALALAPRIGAIEPGQTPPQRGVDLLLVTDGQTWQVDAAIEAARGGRHRIFVIGVGHAAAESVLRRLAETTGGACEFTTPGEALTGAAARMLRRMRQPRWHDLRIDWGVPDAPRWSLPLPLSAFGQDTVIALAGFGPQAQPPDARVRLLGRQDGGDEHPIAVIELACRADGDTLARMAAARRIDAMARERRQRLTGLDDEPNDPVAALERSQQALALGHRLIGEFTHAVLVHARAEGDRATDPAQLHRVASMLAAGWHGTPAAQAHRPDPGYTDYDAPAVWRTPQATPGAGSGPVRTREPEQPLRSLHAFARWAWMRLARDRRRHLDRLPAIASQAPFDPDEAQALAQAHAIVAPLVPREGWRWLLLAIWAARRSRDDTLVAALEKIARRAGLPTELLGQVRAALESACPAGAT